MKKIGFIGTGNMGSALAAAVAKSEAQVFLADADAQKAAALAAKLSVNCTETVEIAKNCDMIFLAVKPHVLSAVAKEISDVLKARKDGVCLVSMAAGITLEKLASLFGNDKIIRIMPNTPASVGAGVILYALGSNASSDDEQLMLNALAAAGSLNKLEESLIDAATAVSGCGPAFVYTFIESMADGGVSCGLPRDKAQKLAAETLLGAAKLCLESGKHPGELKDAVCSPGGSTIAGVTALENGAFRASVINAVIRSCERTKELSGD